MFQVEAVYVPDIDDIVSEWERDLRSSFEVIEIEPEDAPRALRREAVRQRPARNGKGARDSAIWLSAIRVAASGQGAVFVSSNTSDFGVKKSSDIHPELAAEASTAGLTYATSTQELLDVLAIKSEHISLDLAELSAAARDELVDTLLRDGKAHLSIPLEAEEIRRDELHFTSATNRRTYNFENHILCLIMGRVHLANSSEHEIDLEVNLWAEAERNSNTIYSVEIASVHEVQ
ncbi:hypothetical protein C5B99_10730 [Pseudoclavibacter sp. Z016]|nr:hypothetical protein C5B99_10730 [Pseudoclavibacter sp. Z016]